MGTGINGKELSMKKNEILDMMIEDMKKWDGEIESGIELIGKNQERLNKIRRINDVVLSQSETINDKDYYEKINMAVQELRKMTAKLNEAKKELLKEKRILNKKNEMVDSYISTNKESVFIDKDIY